MQYNPVSNLASIQSELEGTWKNFDDVYATLSPHDWSRKFGTTWTYADQPYHLAYFDRMHADYIVKGTNVPVAEQIVFNTINKINEWNAKEFAKKQAGHTYERSLQLMRESRDVVRSLTSKMTDKNLSEKAWNPLLCGWVTKAIMLKSILVHNTGEYYKLWFRTGKKGPMPNPAVVHLRLELMMNFMSLMLNKEAAANKHFTLVWNFDGPGGGAWTFQVHEGQCTVSAVAAEHPNLMITMKPETFQKMVAKMESPVWLMLSGQVKIRGFGAMGAFGKLFPEPPPDKVIIEGPGSFAIG
ncbi:MAG: SCP2 sterol-binding domain-containing protein [Bacteroidota bacterium]|nr:SCP2 sterol-binding domain-containing protein [Bacteroidota bacterium]